MQTNMSQAEMNMKMLILVFRLYSSFIHIIIQYLQYLYHLLYGQTLSQDRIIYYIIIFRWRHAQNGQKAATVFGQRRIRSRCGHKYVGDTLHEINSQTNFCLIFDVFRQWRLSRKKWTVPVGQPVRQVSLDLCHYKS